MVEYSVSARIPVPGILSRPTRVLRHRIVLPSLQQSMNRKLLKCFRIIFCKYQVLPFRYHG